jgi:hypothetical protein
VRLHRPHCLADGYSMGLCNRAYDAMFDAAHAALLRSGAHINPAETKHIAADMHSGGRVKPDFFPPSLVGTQPGGASPAACGLHR